MIQVEEIANGYLRIHALWPKSRGVRIRLDLTDPDGDVQKDIFVWTAPRPMLPIEALTAIVDGIDALPHWRAVRVGNELSIGTAHPDYSGVVRVDPI